MAHTRVQLQVNGERHDLEVEPRLLLVHLLRDKLGLTGTHVGCDTSNCGACTVHLNGQAVKSCTVLAVQAARAARRGSRRTGRAGGGGMTAVGQPLKRKEDPRLITGKATYVDDVVLPGMLHAAFVRSTEAHAKVTSIDASEALERPGVRAVL